MTTRKENGERTGRTAGVSEEVILKVAKEVAIKFIETGRLTPATFDQAFRKIHSTIQETVNGKDHA